MFFTFCGNVARCLSFSLLLLVGVLRRPVDVDLRRVVFTLPSSPDFPPDSCSCCPFSLTYVASAPAGAAASSAAGAPVSDGTSLEALS